MKHKLYLLVLLVLFPFLAGETLAAPKPPANICFQLIPTSPPVFTLVISLVVKSVGSMTMADGPTNFYAINGYSHIGNSSGETSHVTGTGHMDKDTNGMFHFSVGGSGILPVFSTIQIEGYWNLVTKAGNGFGRVTLKEDETSPTQDYNTNFTLLEVFCKDIHIPGFSSP